MEHIRKDSNKLHNYMIRFLPLDRMAEVATLVPHIRSIKVTGGDNRRDYLPTELRFTAKANKNLRL